MITRLLIARHGNTFGPGEIVTRVGRTDLPLVESGLEQGRQLGLYLKAATLIPNVIFTSALQRTRQTAEQAQLTMGTSLPLTPLEVFNEIDYGPDENKPETEVVSRLGKDALELWDSQGIVPSGWNVDPNALIQHWYDFSEKVLRDNRGQNVLLVTSNGIARFAPYLTGDFDAFRMTHNIKLSTGALCIFEHAGTTWDCKVWNLKPKDKLKPL